jgi:hypothetical protein
MLVTVVLLVSIWGTASAGKSPPHRDGVIQEGSLANQQLIRDAMQAVVMKAGTLGCTKMDSFTPYVLAMPEGVPGARMWKERWVITCAGKAYPVNIRFNEAGMEAAMYNIE